MKLDKQQLRRTLRAKRQALPAATAHAASAAVTKRLKLALSWSSFQSVHIYLPMKNQNELDTWELLHWLWREHPSVETYTSLYKPPRSLEHVLINETTTFTYDSRGIPKPDGALAKIDKFDCIIVPLLGFDAKKHRLGFGKGVYDHFLAEQDSALKVGLCYEFGFISAGMPTEEHDVQLDTIITDAGMH